ncbi:uncharacterized protein [Anabrus simplex]|uniref:uncharacterized protein isoform X2 n=1 Tax=Anabrus simplex TaxID=316456 RepID=UPI0035A3C4F6
MVSHFRTDMKIPIRPAPAPPTDKPNGVLQRSSTLFNSWDDSDPFGNSDLTRSSSVHFDQPQRVKKKPPPRPPPPKFNQKNQQKQGGSHSNYVLSGLFSRRSNSGRSVNSSLQKQSAPKESNIFTASLIDLHSPASSPTPTTRSSSDGVSVNSFGSDGSASNNGHTTIGSHASGFENGFEDDFDFFGGLSASNMKTPPVSDQKDPWSVSWDPFSPPRQPQSTEFPTNTTWFEEPSIESLRATPPIVKPPAVTSTIPTIIRVKPNRPPALPKSVLGSQTKSSISSPISVPVTSPPEIVINSSSSRTSTLSENFEFDVDTSDWSPPMPSIPPPPPPPEVLEEYDFQDPPNIPPRPIQYQTNEKEPHGIALYDYPATHPDDLALKVNDVVYITKKINAEWLHGRINQREGMFPANFIRIVVPLPSKEDDTESAVPTVTALYPFSAESWDDLDFPEGAVIHVLSRINADWLYGEYRGKSGQFPSSFVDHIPADLPQRKT